jgi:hypothetical protein
MVPSGIAKAHVMHIRLLQRWQLYAAAVLECWAQAPAGEAAIGVGGGSSAACRQYMTS